MKAILFLPLFLVFTEYNSMTSDSSHNLVSINKKFIAPDSRKLNLTDWSESLSDFRNALLRGDKATVKSYFDFPIENPGNDIWYVADTRFVSKMKPDKIVPFQESDFDTYYSAILPIDFRKTLEKINIKKLVKDKSTETSELIVVSPATSKMKATYSEGTKTVTLSLITKSPEFGQFTIDYHFKVLTDGNIKFSYVRFII